MLARPSPAVCSCLGSLSRCSTSYGRAFISARLNSSVAAEPTAPKDTAQDAAVLTPKRSVPKAALFGDIVIPGANGPAKAFARSGNKNDFKPDLSWLGDDEFDRGGLSRRLARRRDAPPSSQATATPESAPPVLHAEAVQLPSLDPLPIPHPLPVQRQENLQNVMAETRARRERRLDGQAEGRRNSEGERRRPEGERRRPEGERRRSEGERRRSEGERQRFEGERQVEAAQQRQTWTPRENNREGRVQRGRDQVRDTPRRQASPREARSQDTWRVQAREEKSAPREPARSPPPLPMHIQTTDLSTLFGPVDAAPASLAKIGLASSKDLSIAASRRVQVLLEKSGGDYSRYLPADLGTALPETLGPIGCARLVMAKRRDVGLKMRNNALGIVQHLVVQKVVGSEAQTEA